MNCSLCDCLHHNIWPPERLKTPWGGDSVLLSVRHSRCLRNIVERKKEEKTGWSIFIFSQKPFLPHSLHCLTPRRSLSLLTSAELGNNQEPLHHELHCFVRRRELSICPWRVILLQEHLFPQAHKTSSTHFSWVVVMGRCNCLFVWGLPPSSVFQLPQETVNSPGKALPGDMCIPSASRIELEHRGTQEASARKTISLTNDSGSSRTNN